MANLVLHLGSNLGDRIKNISIAAFLLSKKLGKQVVSSAMYETQAWGNTEQPDFINQVIVLDTKVSPQEVLSVIDKIEKRLGRIRIEKWGARIIDIDILFYNDQIIEKADLKIPHPEITNRNFVLEPLVDILPDFIHPVYSKTVKTLLDECSDVSQVRRLNT